MPSPAVPTKQMDTSTHVTNGVRKRRPRSAPNAGDDVGASVAKVERAQSEFDFTARKNGVDASVHIRVGDCRQVLRELPAVKESKIDLVFADPPFNWNRAYDKWDDALPEKEYLDFTYEWLHLCIDGLRPGGALWVNIPDDWAAEIVCYLKGRMERKPPAVMVMQNWCIWHYRFGQNATGRFINSKVHALYFIKSGGPHVWNPLEVVEMSDRAAIYGDKRTLTKKDGMPAKMRVPLDVWYGRYWGRVQGNNSERRDYHDNQLPELYLDRVVRACTSPEALVLDPFLGSGTTGVLAHALGRHFIGIEFSKTNAQQAARRIRQGPKRIGLPKEANNSFFPSRRTLP